MSNKKKIIIICSMVVLLVAAAYLNVLITKKNTEKVSGTISDDSSTVVSFFTSYRSARDASRQESFMYYDSIINSETAFRQISDMTVRRKNRVARSEKFLDRFHLSR